MHTIRTHRFILLQHIRSSRKHEFTIEKVAGRKNARTSAFWNESNDDYELCGKRRIERENQLRRNRGDRVMAVVESTINTLTQSSPVVFLTIQVMVDAYAGLKFKSWIGKNL
jgi:hypothetical protein